MIKKMRLRIIMVSMIALMILLGSIFITTNIYMGQVAIHDTDRFLDHIMGNNGEIYEVDPIGKADYKDKEGVVAPVEKSDIRGVSLRVSNDGVIEETFFNGEIATVSEINTYVNMIIEGKLETGNVDNYRYRVKKLNDGYIIVIADIAMQNDLLDKLFVVSIKIGLISMAFLFIFIIILSKYITKPVEETFLKQKRFIADSSHELKTPISIISANLEMLEMEIGSNRRIDGMSDSIKRMNKLIHELLILARTEQKIHSSKHFDISNVIESTILTLEVIAFEQGNTIETDIEEDVIFNGDEESIVRLIGALMENAIKYSRRDTVIKASFIRKGDNKIIEIYNEGIGVTKEQKERLFDKFYRVDDSRQRETGGYGIGLSIVKNIVDMHNGKIQIESIPNEYIVFKIILHG